MNASTNIYIYLFSIYFFFPFHSIITSRYLVPSLAVIHLKSLNHDFGNDMLQPVAGNVHIC